MPKHVYYAALLGLVTVLGAIIESLGDDPQRKDVINAQGGGYGNALQVSSCQGHEKVEQILLNQGAEVNAQVGYYGYALQAASYQGHAQVVQILLDQGAEVIAQGGKYSEAHQAQ